jgi:hypothetical protein
MKIRILEDRGIYTVGAEVEMSYAQGQQWLNSGFAEHVVEKPKAKLKPKKVEKPKAEPTEKVKEPEETEELEVSSKEEADNKKE